MSLIELPDAEAQCVALAELIRPQLSPNTVLIGIHSGGVWIAQRLRKLLGSSGFSFFDETGLIDVSFYRDDFGEKGLHPQIKPTSIPCAIEDRHVLLVDDVLYTGRTIRAAIDALLEYGRPARVQLAVLVDRGHRELPIRPDYVGKNVPTASTERVSVELREIDGQDRVLLAGNPND